jgi:hypothetical protein
MEKRRYTSMNYLSRHWKEGEWSVPISSSCNLKEIPFDTH